MATAAWGWATSPTARNGAPGGGAITGGGTGLGFRNGAGAAGPDGVVETMAADVAADAGKASGNGRGPTAAATSPAVAIAGPTFGTKNRPAQRGQFA
jgi:hypothetical protein